MPSYLFYTRRLYISYPTDVLDGIKISLVAFQAEIEKIQITLDRKKKKSFNKSDIIGLHLLLIAFMISLDA